MNLVAVRSAGRPRDDSRDTAILQATIDVLKDVGYDRLTIEAVAAKAHASKATVYRRWANKGALVVEAMSCLKPLSDADGEPMCFFPDTGSLRGDLIAGLQAIATNLTTDEGRLMRAVMTATHRDPELAVAMQGGIADKARSCQTVADRALDRGEITSTAGIRAFVEVIPALLYNRLLVTGEPFDTEFINHVVDNVAFPLLMRS